VHLCLAESAFFWLKSGVNVDFKHGMDCGSYSGVFCASYEIDEEKPLKIGLNITYLSCNLQLDLITFIF
jgi:hypothetical protein